MCDLHPHCFPEMGVIDRLFQEFWGWQIPYVFICYLSRVPRYLYQPSIRKCPANRISLISAGRSLYGSICYRSEQSFVSPPSWIILGFDRYSVYIVLYRLVWSVTTIGLDFLFSISKATGISGPIVRSALWALCSHCHWVRSCADRDTFRMEGIRCFPDF